MHERLTAVFTKLGVDYEIIFVNDSSPDDAREVLAELAARDPRVIVINHTRNFGSQSAFTSGMRIATGDAVILLDGDLQDPPELIEVFVDQVAGGLRRRLRRARQARRDALPSARVQGLLPGVPRRLLRADPARRGRLLAHRPPGRRRAERAAREQPLRARPARVGRLQADRRAVRPAGADVRHVDELADSKTWAWAKKAIFSFSYAPLNVITGWRRSPSRCR